MLLDEYLLSKNQIDLKGVGKLGIVSFVCNIKEGVIQMLTFADRGE